jgi:hypothetical protein
MKAVAIITESGSFEGPRELSQIASVGCDKCDAEYTISHKRTLKGSPARAAEQAAQLKRILDEDHSPKEENTQTSLNLNDSGFVVGL